MKIEESVEVAVSAAQAWRVAGDVAGIADWAPVLESATVEGDVRTAVFAGGGGVARERVLRRDDAAQFYEYEYLDGPLTLDKYVSRISVAEGARGSVVTWAAEFTAGNAEAEAELATAVSGMYRQGLEGLRARLTAAP
ncbi:SRPBCC family protein [Amycolatopsis thermoflava]|uniref:SRPBCC family protein n=1 Tax=Amycolatopsis thermoflava TaxID=84480 RepID=UPI0037F23104